MATILSGDLQGSVLWDTYWTFWGPNAHRLRGIEIIWIHGGKYHRASDIAAAWKIKTPLLETAAAPIAAGPAGSLVDIAERAVAAETYAIEFTDGNQIVVVEEFPWLTRPFQIFKKHVEENGLLRRSR